MPDVKPTTFVNEYAPWSISKADCAKQCPHRFYLQYVLKKRTGLPTSTEALVGTAVHSALEYIFTGRPLNKCFKLAAETHNLTTEEIEQALNFVPAARNFLRKYESYSARHRMGNPVIESRLAIDIDGNPVRYFDNKRGFLRGVIDMYALFKKTPYALILDHKTGREYEIEHFMNQFKVYMLLLKSERPALEKIQLGINFLKTDKVEMVKGMLDIRDIQPVYDDVVTHLNISTKNTHKFKTPRQGPLCGWCDYKHSGDCLAYSDSINGKNKK